MIKIVSTAVDNQYRELDTIEPGAWIHLEDPTPEEINRVIEEIEVEEDFVRAALDEEEMPRLDYEDGKTLIIVDIPIVVPDGTSFRYDTVPLGIILSEEYVVTICLEETSLVEDFWNKRIRGGFDTCKRTRFVLQLLYKNASKFLQYLRQIDKATTQVERALRKSMKNSELIQMMRLEKSLVFFATSLKSNEVVLEKILRGTVIKKYPDDTDLLEDVIIENKQAIEMCTIYRDILSGTMDAFASIISNNLNIVMKLLASITIVMAIPTMFASFWGMNVGVPWEGSQAGFWIVLGLSLVTSLVVAFVLWKKKMF